MLRVLRGVSPCLRLSIIDKWDFLVLNDSALIRELHTYGRFVPISAKSKKAAQHKGLGRKLMAEAERIVKKETDFKKIAVISGIGVREYYRKLGYRLKDEYMIKRID